MTSNKDDQQPALTLEQLKISFWLRILALFIPHFRRQLKAIQAQRQALLKSRSDDEETAESAQELTSQSSDGESKPADSSDEEAGDTATQSDFNSDSNKTIAEEPAPEPESLLSRMRRGLSRTRSSFSDGLGSLVLGRKEIDDELLEDIESQLLMADVGMDATSRIIGELTDMLDRKELTDPERLQSALQSMLTESLKKVEVPLSLPEKSPAVILVVGVNGVGKTTTIGKLAKRLQSQGKSVMLAAGDTFRAAAVEQLQVWGERNDVPVVAQHTGADSASVIFDAVQSAQSRDVDVVIADTAGRLHNKSNLMEELSKVKRVMGKLDDQAPHEVLLVLDAGTGQNALSQAEHFSQAAGVTGIALTKLDGTAKGGIIFALSEKFGIPVRFVGVGEGIDDLQPFEAEPYIQALFGEAEG